MTLVILTLGALAVSADFRKAVYTMIQKFLPIEMQLTYQVDGEPLERLPDGYSDHYVPDGFEMDDAQKFERAENFLHVYSSKETEESYTVRCSIIQPGQQSLFDKNAVNRWCSGTKRPFCTLPTNTPARRTCSPVCGKGTGSRTLPPCTTAGPIDRLRFQQTKGETVWFRSFFTQIQPLPSLQVQ